MWRNYVIFTVPFPIRKYNKMSRNHRVSIVEEPLWSALLFLILGLATVPGRGQEATDSDQARKAERLESLREMKEMIGTLKVSSVNEADKVETKPLAKPLLHYYDQPRKILDATLWCFGEQGRPSAFCKIEKIAVADRNRWLYCFASLSTSPIEAEWADGKTFSATNPGVRFMDLQGAPVPAEGKEGRSRQVKELVRRVNVSLADPDLMFRENLRLLTQPLHRYEDAKAGILEGAIFGFSTNGTCPDLIVLVEAQRGGATQNLLVVCAVWRICRQLPNDRLTGADGSGKIMNRRTVTAVFVVHPAVSPENCHAAYSSQVSARISAR